MAKARAPKALQEQNPQKRQFVAMCTLRMSDKAGGFIEYKAGDTVEIGGKKAIENWLKEDKIKQLK